MDTLLYGEGTCGSACAYAFNRSTGTLTIRAEGRMPDYDSAPWANFKELVTKIEIQPDCTYIATNAFLSCDALTEVTLPTSLQEIGNYAFRYCSKLKTIKIASAYTSGEFTYADTLPNLTTIGNYAFANCLEYIHLSTQFPALTTIGQNAFEKCTKLCASGAFVLPNSITSVGQYAFLAAGEDTTSNPFRCEINCNLNALGNSVFSNIGGANLGAGGLVINSISETGSLEPAIELFKQIRDTGVTGGTTPYTGLSMKVNPNRFSITVDSAKEVTNAEYKGKKAVFGDVTEPTLGEGGMLRLKSGYTLNLE